MSLPKGDIDGADKEMCGLYNQARGLGLDPRRRRDRNRLVDLLDTEERLIMIQIKD